MLRWTHDGGVGDKGLASKASSISFGSGDDESSPSPGVELPCSVQAVAYTPTLPPI